ncbi:response regulator [Xanthobacteraceae bacterium A53D]
MASAAYRPDLSDTPRTVLVAEDDAFLRLLIADALRDEGLRVIEAASADDAFTALAAGIDVHALFTDVRMPGTMDGVELSRRVTAHWPTLPVFVTSGDLDPLIASGLPDFVPKPYDLQSVVGMILDRLQSGRSLE